MAGRGTAESIMALQEENLCLNPNSNMPYMTSFSSLPVKWRVGLGDLQASSQLFPMPQLNAWHKESAEILVDGQQCLGTAAF